MNAETKIQIARMEVEVAQIELREAKMNAQKAEDDLIVAQENTRQARIAQDDDVRSSLEAIRGTAHSALKAVLTDLEQFEPPVMYNISTQTIPVKTSPAVAYANKLTARRANAAMTIQSFHRERHHT